MKCLLFTTDESLFRKAKAIDRETVDSAISIVKEAAIKLTANEKVANEYPKYPSDL